jgi:hypothetical protein
VHDAGVMFAAVQLSPQCVLIENYTSLVAHLFAHFDAQALIFKVQQVFLLSLADVILLSSGYQCPQLFDLTLHDQAQRGSIENTECETET